MDRETLQSKLYLRCALPLAKVLRYEKPSFDRLFDGFSAVVQFVVENDPELATQLIFEDGEATVAFGVHERPTLTFAFSSKNAFNGFMAGKMGLGYMPKIRPLWRVGIIRRVLPLLLGLKILDPNNIPSDPEKQALKVKLTLYMITSALSQLNRCGYEKMADWTKKQPDRIYQWTVENGGPAAFLRVKAGKTKSGRGVYERKRPFVHMIFPDIEGAFKVLTNQAPLVEAVSKGYVRTEGAMEYGKDVGEFMQQVEVLLK